MMPSYDLGVAHGKIQIKSDTREVKSAERAVGDFERKVSIMAASISKNTAALNRLQRELSATERDFNSANRAADKFSGVHTRMNISLGQTTRNIQNLQRSLQAAQRYHSFVFPTVAGLKEYKKSGDALRGITTGLKASGVAGVAVQMLTAKLLGLHKALANIPHWQQSLLKFASIISTVGAAATFFSRFTNAGMLAGAMLTRLASHSTHATRALNETRKVLDQFGPGFKQIAWGITQSISGFALMKQAGRDLLGNFLPFYNLFKKLPPLAKAFIGPGLLSLDPLVQALGKSLQWLSNTFLGLWDGIKQLSGGLLALPGAFVTLGAAIVPLVGVVATLKSNFKDLFKALGEKDPTKRAEALAEAWEKLPDYLKPLGKVIVDLYPKIKDLGDTFTKEFLKGLPEQIQAIANTYLPMLAAGGSKVVLSWRKIKDQLVGFLGQPQTIQDFNTMWIMVADTLNGIGKSMQPLLQGLRDISMVGIEFVRNMAVSSSVVVNKFAEWARLNRENGNLMRWMQDSVKGVKDLWQGMDQLIRATWKLLTLFATNTGENFLERFHQAMKHFNEEVQKSAATGLLHRIGDAVKSIGTDKLKSFTDSLVAVGRVIGNQVVPLLLQFNRALGTVWGSGFSVILNGLNAFLNVLKQLGAGTALGWIVGLISVFNLLKFALAPIGNMIKLIIGAFMGGAGLKNMINGLAVSLYALGGAGEKAGLALRGMSGAIAAAMGPITLIATAVFLLWSTISSGLDKYKQDLADFAAIQGNASKSVQGFAKAFEETRGVLGKPVVQEAINQWNDYVVAVNKAASDTVTFAEKTGIVWNSIWGRLTKPSEWLSKAYDDKAVDRQISQLKEQGNQARAAKKALEDLNITQEQAAQAVTGTNAEYQAFIDNLKRAGVTGDALKGIENMRRNFEQVKAAMDKAGPAAITFAEAIKKIGDESESSATKVDSLTAALKAAGVIPTDAADAQAAWDEKLLNTTDDYANLAEEVKKSGGVILDQNGQIITSHSKVGVGLRNLLESQREFLYTTGVSGGDWRKEWEEGKKTLEDNAAALGLTKEEADALWTQYAGNPLVLQFAFNAKGKDVVQNDINTLFGLVEERKLKGDNNIEFTFKAQGGQATIDQLKSMGIQAELDKNTGYITLKFDANNPANAAALKRVEDTVAAGKPITIETILGTPPPLQPAEIKPTPDNKPVEVPTTLAPVAPTDMPDWSNALPFPQAPAAAPPAPAPAGAPPAPAPAPAPAGPAPGQPPTATNPYVATLQDAANQATAIGAQMMANFANGITSGTPAVVQAIENMKNAIGQNLTASYTWLQNSGRTMMENLAAGIAAGAPAVIQAVDRILQEIRDRQPHSPAKKGPLSGTGWSGYAGTAVAKDFAQGIKDSAAQAAQAANVMAGGVATVLGGGAPGAKTGEFLKQFKDLFGFAQHLWEIGETLFNTAQNFLKWLSDPLNKGGFFGAQLPYVRAVNERDLERRRQDALQAKLTGAIRDGTEDGSFAGTSRGIGELGDNPTQTEIAGAIFDEAQRRGYSKRDAVAIVATGLLESGLDPDKINELGRQGIFQQDEGYPLRETATGQIRGFFDRLAKTTGATIEERIAKLQAGGYGAPRIQAFEPQARKLIGSLNANTTALGKPSILRDTGAVASGRLATNAAALIARYFPQITDIGGTRTGGAAPGTHQVGRAIDIVIPGAGTPAGIKLGNQIRDFLQQNAKQLGIVYTIWQNQLQNTGLGGRRAGPGGIVTGHMDHIDVQFLDQLNVPRGGRQPAPPKAPDTVTLRQDQPLDIQQPIQLDPTQVDQMGFPQEQLDLSQFTTQELEEINQNGGYTLQNQEDMLTALRQQNPLLDEAITVAQNPTSSDVERSNALISIDNEIAAQNAMDTPASRAQASSLESLKSEITSQYGLQKMDQPLNTMANIASGVGALAKDIFGLIESGLESIDATKYIADTLVRGIQNTEDLYNIVDQVQKYIEFAARIANTVGDVSQTIGSIVQIAGQAAAPSGSTAFGGSPAGGIEAAAAAFQAVAMIAQTVAAGLQAVNGIIDLAQEAWRIFGSYFGQYLGFLAGGTTNLQGNVKFLLDQNSGLLYAYSASNPQLKTGHPIPGATVKEFQQGIGPVNVYGGPGADPRDLTRNMLYQIQAAQYAGATRQ